MYISQISWEGLGPNQAVTVGMSTNAGQAYATYRVSVVYPTTADFKAKTIAQIETDALAQFQQDYPNLGT